MTDKEQTRYQMMMNLLEKENERWTKAWEDNPTQLNRGRAIQASLAVCFDTIIEQELLYRIVSTFSPQPDVKT